MNITLFKNEPIFVSNIQRFSLHDGPGIRTTVFLKGCNLHCPWCANVENISHEVQNYCVEDAFGNVTQGQYGRYMTSVDVFNELTKDITYYDCDNPDPLKRGGVTYSGGEPLLQVKNLEALWNHVKANNINQAIETALFVPKNLVEIAFPYINLWIVDIKILDANRCLSTIGGDISIYKNNVSFLIENIAKNNGYSIIFRIPFIYGFTNDENNQMMIIDLLNSISHYDGIMDRVIAVDILAGHNLGKKKYESLGLKCLKLPNAEDVTNGIKASMEQLRRNIESIGYKANICIA